MTYEPYATPEYYRETYGGSTVPEEKLRRDPCPASRHSDSLPYHSVLGRGFFGLTAFQQDVIREVVCQQADFEYDNADEIDTILSGYSLNGASVQFGSSWNVYTEKGVAIKRDVYTFLSQTGLCCRIAR